MVLIRSTFAAKRAAASVASSATRAMAPSNAAPAARAAQHSFRHVQAAPLHSSARANMAWFGGLFGAPAPRPHAAPVAQPVRAAPAAAASAAVASPAASASSMASAAPVATLKGEPRFPSHAHKTLFHGTDEMTMAEIIANGGLAQKGSNMDLGNHLIGGPNSAFRGASQAMSNQGDPDSGPNYFAGENGLIAHIDGEQVPSHDANSMTQDQYRKADGSYGSHPYAQEAEQIIDSRVDIKHIHGFDVKKDGVKTYHENPHYVPLDPNQPKYRPAGGRA